MDQPFDWLTLDDDEEIVWSATPHKASMVPVLLVGIPMSLILIGIPIVVGGYLSIQNTNYVVTTSGLYKKTGILSRDVQKIDFDKVQNISYTQGVIAKRYGYGNVDISTAGGGGVEMQFQAVPEPKDVQERINRLIRESKDGGRDEDGQRGKADVLDEILTELQAIRHAVEGKNGAESNHPEGGNERQ